MKAEVYRVPHLISHSDRCVIEDAARKRTKNPRVVLSVQLCSILYQARMGREREPYTVNRIISTQGWNVADAVYDHLPWDTFRGSPNVDVLYLDGTSHLAVGISVSQTIETDRWAESPGLLIFDRMGVDESGPKESGRINEWACSMVAIWENEKLTEIREKDGKGTLLWQVDKANAVVLQ